jgi:hypothetical protein
MREITMTDLCNSLNNYFEKKVIKGDFNIENGGISLPFLVNGQYFRIVGSLMNDGVYKYPCDKLTDESFSGEVWSMGVPPTLIDLLADINEWQNEYGKNAETPYQSESFAGYSYTKATDSVSGGAVTWQIAFRNALSRWRKI